MLGGNFIGGMWWFLIGLFVRGAARMAYQQLLIRQAFLGVPVSRVMDPAPATVEPGVSLADLEDALYHYRLSAVPVTERDELVGCVTVSDMKRLPRERWAETSVGEIMRPCASDNTVGAGEDAFEAFQRMAKSGNRRLLVADDGRLAGILSMRDMMEYLAIRMDLEGEDSGPFTGAMMGGEEPGPRR